MRDSTFTMDVWTAMFGRSTCATGPAMLHVLAATLSLLLLAGMFAARPPADDTDAARSAERACDARHDGDGND